MTAADGERHEGEAPSDVPATDGAQEDLALRRQRLRWRARRGLLENDIVLERFLETHGDGLDAADLVALEKLLERNDKDLFALIRGHAEPDPDLDGPDVPRVLAMLRRT